MQEDASYPFLRPPARSPRATATHCPGHLVRKDDYLLTRPLRYFLRRSAWLTLLFSLTLIPSLSSAQQKQSDNQNAQNDVRDPYWQFGLFAAGGFVPNYYIRQSETLTNGQADTLTSNIQLDLWSAGFLGGRMITGFHGSKLFRGRTEAMLEVIPFWLAQYPHQTITITNSAYGTQETNPNFGPVDKYGASITPFLIRYNFQHQASSRILPWTQLGGGLLWTNHKFPYEVGSTSVINFTPQGGIGFSTFLRRRQSIDLALKIIHISSAGLGDNNPGINYSLQFSAGYSWWK